MQRNRPLEVMWIGFVIAISALGALFFVGLIFVMSHFIAKFW